MLSPDDLARIEGAVREAERDTSGEIVVVVAGQAAGYRSVPLLYGFIAALVAPWPLIWLTQLGPVRIFALQLVAALAVVAACAWPAPNPRLLPRRLRRVRAREAAEREFTARGLRQTRGRTGILLYLALAERHAEVIGDVAIAGRVDEAEWRAVIEPLVGALGRAAAADGIVAAVERIGAILARHVPPGSGDTDELPNRVVQL